MIKRHFRRFKESKYLIFEIHSFKSEKLQSRDIETTKRINKNNFSRKPLALKLQYFVDAIRWRQQDATSLVPNSSKDIRTSIPVAIEVIGTKDPIIKLQLLMFAKLKPPSGEKKDQMKIRWSLRSPGLPFLLALIP